MLLDDCEREIQEREEFIVSQNEKIKTMHEVLTELIEYKIVLEKANVIVHGNLRSSLVHESFHSEADLQQHNASRRISFGGNSSLRAADMEENKHDQFGGRASRLDSSFREVSIKYISGTLPKEEVLRFKRLLFRVTRGMYYFQCIITMNNKII